ncbi:MAG TPA: YciI family protein [Terriglobales bacterium]|nr:YciI family protein [Terriglobales bacterium]
MRFMIMVKANQQTEANAIPSEKLIAEMAKYHEELAKAGVLLDASGLQPTSHGWRVKYSGDNQIITDGPFAETKELIAGYTLIRVNSREEALHWINRFPNPSMDGGEAQVEVRQLKELEDFGPSEAIRKFQELELASQK